MMWLRIVAVAAAMSAMLSACAAPQEGDEVVYNASYPAYESVTELSDAADLVVEGTVVSSVVKEIDVASKLTGDDAKDPEANPGGPDQDSPSVMVYTVHKVRVDRVFKGSAVEGSTIEIKELGGTQGNTKYSTEEGIVLRDTKSYVMFLATYDGIPASLLNPIEAVYERVDGKLTSMPGNPIKAEEVSRLLS